MLLTPAQIKPKSFESRRNFIFSSLFFFFFFFSLFLPGVDAPHVTGVLGRFHSLISTRLFRRAMTASVDSCAESPFSGVTKSGKVWRKVPKSDARSVVQCILGLVPHSHKGISVPATTSPEQCVVHVRYSSPLPLKGYRPPPIPLRSLFRLATSACIMWRKPNIPHCRHIWVVSATTRRELTLSLP